MADEFRFDGKDLEDLTRDLRRAAEHMHSEVDRTVWEIGGEVAETAKAIASQHSTTIPATIKMRPLPGAALISAGDSDTQIATLFELGNKGAKRSATTFRHPVFGNKDVWVEETKHPYLRPALSLRRRQITKRMEQAWDHALIPYRLRPEGLSNG